MNLREECSARPVAVLALAAAAGIALAENVPFALSSLFWLTPIIAITSWLTWRFHHSVWPLLLCALIFSALHHQELQETRQHPLYEWLGKQAHPQEVTVLGNVAPSLRGDLPGAKPGEALFHVSEVLSSAQGFRWKGYAKLCLLSEGLTFEPGQYQITGQLALPFLTDNPGQFDRRTYDLRRGLIGNLRVTRAVCLQKDVWNLKAKLLQWAADCRKWMTQSLSLDLDDAPNEKAVILAMALGTVESDSADMQRPFRESGTLHIFSVSGLHVAIVGLIFWMLIKPWRAPRGLMLGMLIFFLFSYAFITGWKPSAIRAAIMTTVFLCGSLLHRRADIFSSLGMAALLILALDTNQLFAPGFLLSFMVLAAIGLFNGILTRPFRNFIEPDFYLPKPLLTTFQKFCWEQRRHFIGLFTISAAAWIGSLPLIFNYFNLVTPISLLANVVLVPLSFCVLFTAILTLVASGLQFGFVALLFSNANLALAKMTVVSAQYFAALPAGNFYLPPLRFEERAPIELTALRLPAGGGANFLQAGDKHWLLDVGAAKSYPFLLRPYLQSQGINHVSNVILSHQDFEHTGAFSLVSADFEALSVFTSRQENVPKKDSRHVFTSLSAGDSFTLGENARALVLYPTAEIQARRSDDRSLVIRLTFPNFSVLWCSDAGFIAEKTLLEKWSPEMLKCDVVIRNQHVSDFSMLPEFLNVVQPKLVISANQNFPPEQKIVPRLREYCLKRGITLLDQNETGAVTLRFWENRLEARTFRGQTSPFLLTAPTFPR